ncbi:alanine--glyoxylate aminotransferase family protein [Candidatus Aerophobetes bacterium]|nr:alanine--glyoxylate aminotransferase family protein [Candidatus Aerophobetes bacterium]
MKTRIFTPGPTPLPEKVRLSQAKQIIHHRTKEFSSIFEDVCQSLKYVFQTKNDVLTFAASGTGAMEAVVANLFSPQDEVLVVRGGKFGERWENIAEAFGLKVTGIDIEWGRAPDPLQIREKLHSSKTIRAVLTQLVETSTGVRYDIESIGKVVSETSAVLVVDAISGLGAEPLLTDEWGVDVVVAGSQKGFMLPPGLCFVSLSEKARKLMDDATCPRYYWDFKKAQSALVKGQTAFTPAVSLICALRESLALIKEEGLDAVLERHRVFALAVRRAVSSLGLEIFAHPSSNAVTSILVPAGVEEKNLRKKLQENFGVMIAGGQGKLSGKIVRIAHLGWMDKLDIVGVIFALEMTLAHLGYDVEPATGVKVVQEVLMGKVAM